MSRWLSSSVVLAVLLFSALPAFAVEGFPAYVPLPAGVEPPSSGSLTAEDFGEADFWMEEGQVHKQGKHWRSYLAFASGVNPGAVATWKSWKPALLAQGFKIVHNDGETGWTLKRVAGTVESWLGIALGDFQDPLLELIEVQAVGSTFTVPAPAAQPEKFSARDDFPYLTHLPGTVLQQSVEVDEPLSLGVSGVDGEAILAGTGYIVKRYSAPSTLSRLAFARDYRAALTRAGWTLEAKSPGSADGEGPLVASYVRDGRSIWATLSRSDPASDQGISVAVADLGAEDWNARMARDCTVALYGVHFDFNRSTLRPDSEPELEKVRALLAAHAEISISVEGHTDDVGGDDFNLKLSDARARAVVAWLTAHGISANRLSAKGFGETRPVVPNADDLSRARNRRVELRKAGCEPA
ncbi:MAG: OmpA family protein [Thermoanaerobaculia bacterium]